MRRTLTLIALSGLLIGCTGGGGGGGTSGSTSAGGAASSTVVSGAVQAPNGQIAFEAAPTFLERFALTTSAFASLPGLTSVSDGTSVQLVRLNADASSFVVLATTTTAAGRYSFNLTSLGLQSSNDLLVRVSGSSGKIMRAFAVGSTIDLTPTSEAAVQLVLQQLNGAPLSQFTLQEISDIQGAITLLVNIQSLSTVTNLDQAISAVKAAVASNAPLTAFLSAAAAPGQTSQGTGDIGNYLPLSPGNSWNYQSSTNQGPKQYENIVSVNGTKLIGSVPATVRSESDTDGGGTAEDDYVVKDAQGLTLYGNNDTTDGVTSNLAPFTVLHFPLSPGIPFPQLNKIGVDYGQDVDGDGKKEVADVRSQVTVLALETVSVAAGTFPTVAKVQTITEVTVTLSSNQHKLSATNTETVWYAPGVGPIKRISLTQGDAASEAITEELTSYSVEGATGGALPVIADAPSAFDRPAIASDGTNYLVAACSVSPASPGIIGVLISGSGRIISHTLIASGDCQQSTVAQPAVSFDGTNYLVVYGQNELTNANAQIRGSRVSTSGTLLDPSGFLISTSVLPAPVLRNSPAVAFDGSNYLVTWSSGQPTARIDIAAARVTPSGQALGEFSITAAIPGAHGVPSMIFDGTNYFVIWTDIKQGGIDTDVYGARVATDGTVLDPQGIAIATTSQQERNPALAFDGNNYFVVWTKVNPTEIRGMRINTDGSLLDGPSGGGGIGLNTSTAEKISSAVAFDGTTFLVAWSMQVSGTYPRGGILGIKVAPNGNVVGTPPTADGFWFSDQPPSDVALYNLPSLYSINGKTLLVWRSPNQLLGTFSLP